MRMKWMKLALIAGAASVVTGAQALTFGVNPNTTPITRPVTGQAVDTWKFVGKFWGGDQWVSAVQVHQNWIMASKHATPGVGSMFQNAYGSAIVQSCAPPPPGGEDLSLCNITSLPVAATFPKLLVSPTTPIGGADWPVTGYLLATGFGQPTNGTQAAVWVRPNGHPVNYNPLLSSGASIPVAQHGDSGSGVYWFADGATVPVLRAITVRGVTLQTQRLFNDSIKQWADIATGGAVQWTTPAVYSTTRRPRAVSDAQVKQTTHDTIRIRWSKPPITVNGYDSATIQDYFVTWAAPGHTPGYVIVPESGLVTLEHLVTGLTTNVQYKVCVFTRGGGLESNALSSFKQVSPATYFTYEIDKDLNCVFATPRVAPGAPTGLTVNVTQTQTDGTNTVRWFNAQWTAPAPVSGAQVTGYEFAYQSPNAGYQDQVGGGQTSYQFLAVGAPNSVCALVFAKNGETRGPASPLVCK